MSNEVAKPFVWTTQNGEELEPRQMRTSHVFYALRMIFNHTVPAPWRIPDCKKYNGPGDWPIAYRKQAIFAFVDELTRRWGELTPGQLAQLQHIADVCRVLNQKGITQ